MPIPPPRPLRARRHPATPPAPPPPSPPPLPHPRPPLPNSSAHGTGPCKDGRHPPRPPPSRGLLRSNQTGWPRPWGVECTRAGVLVRGGGRGEGMRGGGGGELRAGTDQPPSPPMRSPPTHPLPTPRWPAHPAATKACALGRSAPLPPLPRSSCPPVRPPAQLPRQRDRPLVHPRGPLDQPLRDRLCRRRRNRRHCHRRWCHRRRRRRMPLQEGPPNFCGSVTLRRETGEAGKEADGGGRGLRGGEVRGGKRAQEPRRRDDSSAAAVGTLKRDSEQPTVGASSMPQSIVTHGTVGDRERGGGKRGRKEGGGGGDGPPVLPSLPLSPPWEEGGGGGERGAEGK